MKRQLFRVAMLAIPGIFVIFSASCSSGDDASFANGEPGAERGPCREGNLCDPGLECRSDLCVSAEGNAGAGGTQGTGSGGTNNNPTGGDTATTGGDTATTGGESPMTAGGTGGSAMGGEGQGTAGAGDAGGPAVECNGTHPNVTDGLRSCNDGDCYCNDPFDTCFSAATAAACCEGTPRCGNVPQERGCGGGAHPIVEPTRTCEPGNCLCSGDYNGNLDGGMVDVCWPAGRAASCCPPSIELDCVQN